MNNRFTPVLCSCVKSWNGVRRPPLGIFPIGGGHLASGMGQDAPFLKFCKKGPARSSISKRQWMMYPAWSTSEGLSSTEEPASWHQKVLHRAIIFLKGGGRLAPRYSAPTPSPLLHPPRFTNGHNVIKHLPKLLTHLHHRRPSLDHLSYCHSCHFGNVRTHWYTLVHVFSGTT